MEISQETLAKAVSLQSLSEVEPFRSGDEKLIAGFCKRVFAALENHGFFVEPELDHHGSGYASYISAFLHRRERDDMLDRGEYFETTGILLYVSRLAPIAVFGASAKTKNKHSSGGSSGFISGENLGKLPDHDWQYHRQVLQEVLENNGVELLDIEPLLEAAPADLRIPAVFDGPYIVFDALFFWED